MKRMVLLTALHFVPFAMGRTTPPPDPKADLSNTCIVSGERLGEMGKPVMMDYKGRQIGFCCKSCIGDFEKDPAKYLAKLPAAAKP